MIDPGTQAATTIPVGKMPSGLAVDAGVHRLRGQPLDNTMIAIDTRPGAQTVIRPRGNARRHRRPRQAHRCRQHRSRNRIGHRTALVMPPTAKGVRTMRGETALTRRPVTHPRRLSAGKPQWLPGGAKGCARRDSNPNLLIRRHGPMVRPGAMRVPLSSRWRCREARLSSSLSSELSSAHSAKQRHSQRFLIPAILLLTIGRVKGGEAIT